MLMTAYASDHFEKLVTDSLHWKKYQRMEKKILTNILKLSSRQNRVTNITVALQSF